MSSRSPRAARRPPPRLMKPPLTTRTVIITILFTITLWRQIFSPSRLTNKARLFEEKHYIFPLVNKIRQRVKIYRNCWQRFLNKESKPILLWMGWKKKTEFGMRLPVEICTHRQCLVEDLTFTYVKAMDRNWSYTHILSPIPATTPSPLKPVKQHRLYVTH